MSDVLRVIALGGLGEVGKNMTVYEIGDELIVVDAGMAFPRDEHLGVDVILPDFGYLRDKRVRAVVLTHAHEDHVGALPFLMREIKVNEIWGTRLTLGLVKSKLDEHGLLRAAELQEADPDGAPVQLGPFRLEFIRMAHSIPDCVGIAIGTAAGMVFHTGDWKLDHTPVDGARTDVGRLAELGNRGVDLLCGDSTNAERPGFTRSERVVGEAFKQIIPTRSGRILVSSFASNIHRMQQAIEVGVDAGRKIVVVGRSMRRNMNVARNLGYVEVPEDAIVKPASLDDIPRHQQLVLCTGSQGEPLSALTRIAYNDHPAIKVERGDTVIMSSRPVPGNELRVHDTINRLTKNGAEVLHEENADVHVSGHARAEELRTLLSLIRPKAVMPIHGEYRMQAAHARLAQDAGVPADAIVIAENGDVVELSRAGVRIADRIDVGVTYVDGLGVGDITDVALRDRRHMSEDGVLIVVTTLAGNGAAAPELISRGFAENDDELFSEMRGEVRDIVRELIADDMREIKLLQEHIHDGLGQLIYDRTRRRPMILPIVIEV
jgi:ribonuclease J